MQRPDVTAAMHDLREAEIAERTREEADQMAASEPEAKSTKIDDAMKSVAATEAKKRRGQASRGQA